MRNASKLLAVIAASTAIFALAIPAQAAVSPCRSSTGIDLSVDQCASSPGPVGKGDPASVGYAIMAASGLDISLLNLMTSGKTGEGGLVQVSYSPKADPHGFRITDWTVLGGTSAKYITVKAANGFNVDELRGPGAASGTGFTTAGLFSSGGQVQPEITLQSFGPVTGHLPEPAAWVLMLLGFTAVAWGLRRRTSDRGPRMRIP